MRFTVDVQEVTDGWRVRIIDPATKQDMLDPRTGQPMLPEPRFLQRLEVEGEIFPLPPHDDAYNFPNGLSRENLSTAYQSLMNKTGSAGIVERFGRYLFDTLLGQDLWDQIDAVAGGQPIELALTWPSTNLVLNRLPWEIMHTQRSDPERAYEGFLAAEPEIAITRRIPAADTVDKIRMFVSPPRVLFVVGSSLTDREISAGAEYLGLLRNLEKNDRYLYSSVLLNASTLSLEDAVKNFRPDVVHIICHGRPYETGPRLEFFKPDSHDKDYVDAERLFLALKSGSNLPLVVVLNACSTATSEEITVGRPLAADLVQHGVHIVVGMSGRVADQACRLFTSGFYQALLNDGEIGLAAARGRRAAIAHGSYDPRDRVDWALPTLFLSEALGEARLTLQVDDYQDQCYKQAMLFTKRPEFPAFCGRWNFFETYNRLMSNRKIKFLVIPVPRYDQIDNGPLEPKYGSGRLLQELAAQAVRDGHIPILVSQKWLGQKNWPTDLPQFLDMIRKAGSKTAQRLSGITLHKNLASWNWKYLPLLIKSFPNNPAGNDLPLELTDDRLTPEQRLAKALWSDLLDLRKAVCAQRELDERSANVRILLLIKDFHKTEVSDLLNVVMNIDDLLEPHEADHVRCVITYNQNPLGGQKTTVDEIKDWTNSNDILCVPLNALHDDINPAKPLEDQDSYKQAALIYKHFLLHWQDGDQKMPLSIVQDDRDRAVQLFIASLARVVKGLPSRLDDEAVNAVIITKAVVEREIQSFLREADDEHALEVLERTLRQRGK